jgi:hypothetical protein
MRGMPRATLILLLLMRWGQPVLTFLGASKMRPEQSARESATDKQHLTEHGNDVAMSDYSVELKRTTLKISTDELTQVQCKKI